jgi:GTPase SAR1 family protein
VIGSQSAGKSSVLESIVGIDFLPRGEGVCTRRPLELRLVHVPDSEASWAIFDEIPNKKFTDFSQVKDNIQQLTNSVAGGQKNIVDQPIVLAI